MLHLQSSYNWLADLPFIKVLDPDGWDRSSIESYEKSMQEPITEKEFRNRLTRSTICNMSTENGF